MNVEKALRAAAWTSLVVHAIGLVLAATTMRPGTPAAPLLDRIAYLAARPWGWTAGWLSWIACAVSLVAFLGLLARARPSRRTRAAAFAAIVGAMADVTCDALYLAVLPARAAGEVSTFLAFERHVGAASLTGANGLYTLAIALATLALPAEARTARGLGALTVVGGLVLAAAGLIGAPALAGIGTVLAIPAFVAWTFAVSRPWSSH